MQINDLILGPWYWTKADQAPNDSPAKHLLLSTFGYDQSFLEHRISAKGIITQVNASSYLFDDRFLVIMTKGSKTYRVKMLKPWHWSLFDGTHSFSLSRIFYRDTFRTPQDSGEPLSTDDLYIEQHFTHYGAFEVFSDSNLSFYLGSFFLISSQDSSSVSLEIGVLAPKHSFSHDQWVTIISSHLFPLMNALSPAPDLQLTFFPFS